jgi:hypothetical protein
MPWQVGALRQNLGIPDTAIWVFLFYPLTVVGAWHMLRRDFAATMLLLMAALAMCCLYGVFIGNIGAAYRMRSQVWLLFVPFVGIGWEVVNGRSPLVLVPRFRRLRTHLVSTDGKGERTGNEVSKTDPGIRRQPQSIS